ncbi:MAG: chromosome segregation protein SMC [Vicinamibacterales bacterium]
MRLERLEINGFKSFSDRSELAFDKGVTAIVGPNGCGKSNVADAITWVMGEQSAKSLRGEKMEDVIFSGSDARKPTATAEVRLRFSGVLKTVTGPALETSGRRDEQGGVTHAANGSGLADGNGHAPSFVETQVDLDLAAREQVEEVLQSVAREVEVTRRLYRSGESEYLIDGQPCRLRDIHDLLMDTGLGAKAYAIIEQGKIGMILSTRPTDRRQLIEEAAGVTKYKARRRAAELKLDAAQQNLTRIDDIVFEVEKQRGTLKRQAAKARRYQKLRDELRRWEKVLFARKYRQLAETIDAARGRLAEAREREAASSARVAEFESDFGRLRIELAEAESRATVAREAAHASELAINRLQQQIAFDGEQAESLDARVRTIQAEIESLHERRGPARAELDARRAAAGAAQVEREAAASRLSSESEAYESAHRDIEGLEGDVEAARSEVFSSLNAATALRHSLDHAASARDRVLETLSKLQIEAEDARIESERLAADRASAEAGLWRLQEALESVQQTRREREAELATARTEHEWRARSIREREHELAGLRARLKSLEELESRRAEYGDAARTVLAQGNGKVEQRGAVADYIEVEPGYERAVDAYLGELLQHVIVERSEHAVAGFELVRQADAGRCGFLVASPDASADAGTFNPSAPPDGLVSLASVLRAGGPYAAAILRVVGDAWIAPSYEQAAASSPAAPVPIVTTSGEVFKGSYLVTGGQPKEARGILETKGEIRDLRARIDDERDVLARIAGEAADLEAAISAATSAITTLHADQHRQEKEIVAFEAQLKRASEDATKIAQKADQLARERRQAEEERLTLEQRQEEAKASIELLEADQRDADERLTAAQRRLFEAREGAQELGRRAAEARASHATLVERASSIAADVRRLEEATADMERRSELLASELDATRGRVAQLRAATEDGRAMLDASIKELDDLRAAVASADDAVSALRISADQQESAIRVARSELESIRATVSEHDVARATAESDLSHLAQTCVDTVQATLDEVLADVEALEREGAAVPDARVICVDEPDESSDEEAPGSTITAGVPAIELPESSPLAAAEQRTLSAEEAITTLRARIDRLGPVNMMAIEQYDELEARHAFLTTQRRDLVDSIAQTSEAIKRIDDTTRQRFSEAFVAINRHFQEIFSTLFGGGRAGLTLLDENDPLESGIEIVAQPPGKRLQSVQLLSGGEKALTAISLMFGLFRYKPSPFCLLDEIDAPLDDANIGRFVEMLRSMQSHTQFILITHHRKTMEIADRLYGVTMEEPGVSKLISVQLN